MSEKPNYHTLPCGTPIPPEGLKGVARNPNCEPQDVVLMAYCPHNNVGGQYITTSGDYKKFEVAKEPKRIDLSPDTYHGEPLRPARVSEGFPGAFYPRSWGSVGITDHNGTLITWEDLAEDYERYLNGEWQPCSTLEGVE